MFAQVNSTTSVRVVVLVGRLKNSRYSRNANHDFDDNLCIYIQGIDDVMCIKDI